MVFNIQQLRVSEYVPHIDEMELGKEEHGCCSDSLVLMSKEEHGCCSDSLVLMSKEEHGCCSDSLVLIECGYN